MRGFTSQQPSRPTTTRIRLFGNLLVLKTLTSQKNDADALRNAHRRRATSRQLLQRNPDLIGQYNRWRNTHIKASPCYEMNSTNNRLYLWWTTLDAFAPSCAAFRIAAKPRSIAASCSRNITSVERSNENRLYP